MTNSVGKPSQYVPCLHKQYTNQELWSDIETIRPELILCLTIYVKKASGGLKTNSSDHEIH